MRAATKRSRHSTLADLLRQVNPILRGWCGYSRQGVSKRTFGYLGSFAWWRVVGWLCKRQQGFNWEAVRRRLLDGSQIRDGSTVMFRPQEAPVTRYLHRGARIPSLRMTATGPVRRRTALLPRRRGIRAEANLCAAGEALLVRRAPPTG